MSDVGKILDPGNKLENVKTAMGCILRANGKTIHFINSAKGLQKHDPIIFDILPYSFEYDGKLIRMSVAVLPDGFNDIEVDGTNAGKWKNPELHEKWRLKWGEVNNKSNNLGLKKGDWENYDKYRKNTLD